MSIRQLVEEILETGYLSIEVEEQLRQRLTQKYDLDDFNAFLQLQQAAMQGKIRQESRELLKRQSSSPC
ncbi:MAG: hypothetical protein J7641_12705 [Cyanobacteria bacterium SID2]|nr:hypothetical protein [Cyanobacteria bacterium SID2]MBP0002338.1 hypothetical protein [Cyanobacteria bacterium SBC]